MLGSGKITENQQNINKKSGQIFTGEKKATKYLKEWIWEGLGLHLGGGWHGLGRLLDAFGLFFWYSKSKFLRA